MSLLATAGLVLSYGDVLLPIAVSIALVWALGSAGAISSW